MPQLIVIAAIGAGTYLGARWLRKKVRQFKSDLEQAVRSKRPTKPGQTSQPGAVQKNISELKKDPVTGVYRVEED